MLEKLASTATIDAHPEDLEPFGLGAQRKRVAVKAGEGEPRTLYLGGDTPVGGGRYVELANDPNRLFVVSAGSLHGLTPTLLELRDKRLLRLAPDAVDELGVRAGGTLIARAKKTEAGWTLVEPENAPADAERIRRVLDDLALGRASAFEDAPKPAKQYGLDRPELEIVARAGEREERLTLGTADSKTWLAARGRSRDPRGERARAHQRAARVLRLPREARADARRRAGARDRARVPAPERDAPPEARRRGLDVRRTPESSCSRRRSRSSPTRSRPSTRPASRRRASTARRSASSPPLAVVRAFDEKGALLGELSFGDPHPDKGLPALSSQSPLVWRVANDIGREVPLSPEAFTNMLVKSAPPKPAATEPAAEPERARYPLSTASIASCAAPLLATMRAPEAGAGPPSKSLVRPPASSTRSRPAATSHGERWSSQ